MAVADGDVQIAVDPVEVDQVELFQRAAVAALRALDELADTLSLASAGRRIGRGRGHVSNLPRSAWAVTGPGGYAAAPKPTAASLA